MLLLHCTDVRRTYTAHRNAHAECCCAKGLGAGCAGSHSCVCSPSLSAIMLFAIRETLITNWGRDSVHGSLLTGKRGAANKVQPTKDNDTFAADSDNGSNKKGKNRVE